MSSSVASQKLGAILGLWVSASALEGVAEYLHQHVGHTLAAAIYAGVFAVKPVEVKLFCGHNLLCIARLARGMPGRTAHRASNIILISGVAGNLPPPPPTTPENA